MIIIFVSRVIEVHLVEKATRVPEANEFVFIHIARFNLIKEIRNRGHPVIMDYSVQMEAKV